MNIMALLLVKFCVCLAEAVTVQTGVWEVAGSKS